MNGPATSNAKFNEIKVEIDRAVIKRVSIQFNNWGNKEMPEIYVNGDYLTKTGKSIGEFTFSSNHFQGEKKLEVSAFTHGITSTLIAELTNALYLKLNTIDKLLAPPKKK